MTINFSAGYWCLILLTICLLLTRKGNLSKFHFCFSYCPHNRDCLQRVGLNTGRDWEFGSHWVVGRGSGVRPSGRQLPLRPLSLKVHFPNSDFVQTPRQPAYRDLKGKVNLEVAGFKGATSQTFIFFITPSVLGHSLLSFITPTSPPACLL